MLKFESLRPVAVVISKQGLQVKDASLNPELVNFLSIAPA